MGQGNASSLLESVNKLNKQSGGLYCRASVIGRRAVQLAALRPLIDKSEMVTANIPPSWSMAGFGSGPGLTMALVES